MENLAKEIITTTTEKYNEEGVIQEKITEVRKGLIMLSQKPLKKKKRTTMMCLKEVRQIILPHPQ